MNHIMAVLAALAVTLALGLAWADTASAQDAGRAGAAPVFVPLWPGGAPMAEGTAEHDTPAVQVWPADADTATGAAIVVCPGGGYSALAMRHEGRDISRFLNMHGVTAVVVRYRLGKHGYRHPVMLTDASRAVRWVRHHAQELKLDPKRVGILGFSAGGHLASTVLTHFDEGDANAADPIDRQSSRPDLGVLCYAVISMREPYAHMGSRRNLLGDEPSDELIDLLSNEKQVTERTPPCFLWHNRDDRGVLMQNSVRFAEALHAKGVPFELHVYDASGHGSGLGAKPPFEKVLPWGGAMITWLRGKNFAR